MIPKKIALLTDSCVDISSEILRENNVYTIPLRILCKDGEYLDGVNIHNTDIYRRLHAGELPRTSLPSTESVGETLEQILHDGYDGIIAIMLSSGLSGTYNLTRLAAEAIKEELSPNIEMKTYDSLNGSLGQAMPILQAAKDIQNGMSWEELTEHRVPQLIKNTHVFFSVDTLEYLVRGGRIGKVTATAGTILQIKPILTFAPDGQLTSISKVRGKHQVIDRLVKLTIEHCGKHKKYNLAIANGGAPEEMEIIREKLTAALPDYIHIWDGEIDGTLSVYIGDGILGSAVQVLD